VVLRVRLLSLLLLLPWSVCSARDGSGALIFSSDFYLIWISWSFFCVLLLGPVSRPSPDFARD
jgi:hypothetical protein